MQAWAKHKVQHTEMADSAEAVGQVVEYSAAAYQAKHDRPVERLLKDREELLAFYRYPEEHWRHLCMTKGLRVT